MAKTQAEAVAERRAEGARDVLMGFGYATALLPARPRHRRDKAKAEVAVQVVERWILAALRHRTPVDVGEGNGSSPGPTALGRRSALPGPVVAMGWNRRSRSVGTRSRDRSDSAVGIARTEWSGSLEYPGGTRR